jgi:hypothetical protein
MSTIALYEITSDGATQISDEIDYTEEMELKAIQQQVQEIQAGNLVWRVYRNYPTMQTA